MARVASLAILAAGTDPQANDFLAEEYGKVIENVQKGAISSAMKNRDLSGDPTAGSVEAKRFANAEPQAYGTARAAGAGNKIKAKPVTVAIDDDKEFVEEMEEKDTSLYGVDGLVQRRGNNHTLRMIAYLDTKFFATAYASAIALNQSGYDKVEDELEAIIQECETTKNDFVDGVPRALMHLVLSPKYYGKVRNQLDTQTNNANVDTATEEFKVWHGVKTYSCVNLPNGCDYILLVDGAVAQPVMASPYNVEKIPLSQAYGLELFFSCGTKTVTPDLIFKKGVFTAVAANATFDATKTYYTVSNGVYTVADIQAFANGTTYYTMA